MIEKQKITVYDYHGAIKSSAPWHYKENINPTRYDVEAWCVGGKNGIKAFFFINDTLYEANGDDGHWWLIGIMHKDWLEKFKETINSIQFENKN